MQKDHQYQHFFETLRPALKNKAEEMNLLGMDAVREEDIWAYLLKKKWKRPQEDVHIYELVNDIMTVSNSQFMTFTTVEAYKSPNMFGELSSEELKELFKD
jgi:hypothetical protein